MSMEMNPVAAELAASAAGQGLTVPQPAQTFDIAAFREAMAGQAALANAPAPADAAQAAQAGQAPASVAESESFRAVIAMLENLNGDVQQLNTQAEPFTSGVRDMSPGDMLSLTVRCHEFLFHCQLTSNVANRTSEGVQQLFRQQS